MWDWKHLEDMLQFRQYRNMVEYGLGFARHKKRGILSPGAIHMRTEGTSSSVASGLPALKVNR